VRDTFNPNVIAGALVILLPISLAKTLALIASTQGFGRLAALGAGLITLGMLALLAITQSRGAYLALSIGLLLFGALCWPRVFVPITLLGLGSVAVVGSAIGWGVVGRALESSLIFGGMAKRMALWSRALGLIARFPLTGVGLDCFVPVTTTLYPLPRWAQNTVTHVHNLFLQVAVDLGLPGLVAYLVILASSMQWALAAQRLFRIVKERSAALLATACAASLTALIVHGLLDVALWGNKGSFLPWLVLGLSALLANIARERGSAIHPSISVTGPEAS